MHEMAPYELFKYFTISGSLDGSYAKQQLTDIYRCTMSKMERDE